MYLKLISKILLIIILACLQIAFISGLPGFLSQVNLIIIALVFILAFGEVNDILIWSLGLGIIFELYSFLPFGVYLLGIITAAFFIKILMTNFFTDRSLYSFLAITFFSIIYYDVCLALLSFLYHLIFHEAIIYPLNPQFWLNKLYLILVDLAAVFIVFNFINFVSKRLRPVFLFRKKSNL